MRIIGNRGNTARKVQAVASGALASGDTVIVNADGTVSVVAGADTGAGTPATVDSTSDANKDSCSVYDAASGKIVIAYQKDAGGYSGRAIVGTISGTNISFGSVVTFTTNEVGKIAITYDSNAEKIFIAYRDKSNSSYITGVVGTVSGTSISFGTPAVPNSQGSSEVSVDFDSNSNKILLAYRQGNGFGIAEAITISGTSFSSGSASTFNSGNVKGVDTAFSTSANRFVIVYTDSDQANKARYIVATISGANVVYGTEGDASNVYSNYTNVAYDSGQDKFLFVYRDEDASGDPAKARVGTLSGTTVSWGSIVQFTSAPNDYLNSVYNSVDGTMFVSYADESGDKYPKFQIGTISGTSITFGGEIVIQAVESYSGAIADSMFMAYDSVNNKVVVPYVDSTNASPGDLKAAVLQGSSTNLTAENFIGVASNGYATGQAATINAKGFIDDNQSSLTAGQSYFVQTNGDLGLTAADPSVFAGTAVSATKLIVKG